MGAETAVSLRVLKTWCLAGRDWQNRADHMSPELCPRLASAETCESEAELDRLGALYAQEMGATAD